MDDLDDLLSDLENINYHKDLNSSFKKNFNSPENFIESMNRIAQPIVKKYNKNTETLNKGEIIIVNEDQSMQELDDLLMDLNLAKKELNKKPSNIENIQSIKYNQNNDSARPISSLISSDSDLANYDSLDLRSKDSAANKSQASEELENLISSLSSYKIENNSGVESEPIQTINKENSDKIFLKSVCHACNEQINGQVITAMGHLWHPSNCFVCYKCKSSIGTSIFYEKDDKPYCEKDYLELFSPKCVACKLPILDKMLTALNESWHLKCFKCKSCLKPLNDESFLEINSSAYCKDCYVNELAPKCKRCSEAIIDNFIMALDAYFHPSCFVCVECGVSFNATSFYEYQSMPYCEIHYHLKRGSLCDSCQQPINGRCITAIHKKYHVDHFVCNFCQKKLSNGTFKEQNEKPYCNKCFHKLFQH